MMHLTGDRLRRRSGRKKTWVDVGCGLGRDDLGCAAPQGSRPSLDPFRIVCREAFPGSSPFLFLSSLLLTASHVNPWNHQQRESLAFLNETRDGFGTRRLTWPSSLAQIQGRQRCSRIESRIVIGWASEIGSKPDRLFLNPSVTAGHWATVVGSRTICLLWRTR